MPTFSHGRNAVFTIEDSGDVVRDISDALKDISFPATVDTPEATAFKSTAKTYVVGLVDYRISASGFFDQTYAGYLYGILGFATPRAFEYGPEGDTTGEPKYTGTAILTSFQTSASVTDVVAASLEFQISGAVTEGTWV